jgi:predicted nucleic acid-binding protein
MLAALTADARHVYLDSSRARISLLNKLLARCHGHNQVNDAFLLWLAETRGATVLTFDAPLRHLALSAEAVEILS